MRLVAAAALLVGAGVFPAARAAPEDPPPTTTWKTTDERVSLDLPSAWDVKVKPLRNSILRLYADVPGCSETAAVNVYHLPGMRNERAQAYAERAAQPERQGVKERGQIVLEPVPHLIMDIPGEGGTRREVWIFRILERNGFTVHVVCAPVDWGRLGPAVLDAARGLRSTYEEWPARPADYRVLIRDGYEYLLGKDVKDKDLDPLHKFVLEREAEYVKARAPLPKLDSNRPVIVVHAKKQDAAALDAAAAAARHGNRVNEIEGRLFTVPLAKDPEAQAELASQLASLFQYQVFGDTLPSWVYVMDRAAAFHDVLAGKPLPAMAQSQMARLPKRIRPFDQVAAGDAYAGEAELVVYAALFRSGPKQWKEAFAAFWRDLAATGDFDAAVKTHLLALDQTQLAKAAEAFAAKEFKPVKGR